MASRCGNQNRSWFCRATLSSRPESASTKTFLRPAVVSRLRNAGAGRAPRGTPLALRREGGACGDLVRFRVLYELQRLFEDVRLAAGVLPVVALHQVHVEEEVAARAARA